MARTKKNKYEPKATDCILWMRVSTREQEEGYSLDAQTDRLREYCTYKSLKIVKEFTTIESSTRGEREQFYDMIKFVKKQKGCVAIVCDKVDRLQRSFKEVPVLEELRKSGKIELHFRTEGQILDAKANSSHIMAYQMYIMMAESYTNSISDNVKRSYERMIKEGKWAHHAPFGYKNAKGSDGKPTIVPDQETAWIVRELYDKYATGTYNLTDMIRIAGELGFKTKVGRNINKQTIRDILANRFYIGEMYNKEDYNPHIYERIISLDTFNKCQDVLNNRTNHKTQKHDHLFKGMVFCQHCGTLITTDKKTIRGRPYSYLVCPKCNKRVNEERVVEGVKNVMEGLQSLSSTKLDNVLKRLDAKISADTKTERDAKLSYQKQFTMTQTKLSNLLDMKLEGSITHDLYAKKLDEIKRDEKFYQERLSELSHVSVKQGISLNVLINLISHARDLFEVSKNDEKREFLNIVFSKLEFDGKNVVFSKRKPIEKLFSMGFRPLWLGWLDSNQRMSTPKADALPLGDTPICFGVHMFMINFCFWQAFFYYINTEKDLSAFIFFLGDN